MVQNKGLIFKSPPSGWPVPGKDLAVEDRPYDDAQSPPSGGVITQNYYISFDPYQRGRMRAPETKSYSASFRLGSPIDNSGVAKIVKSDTSEFKVGDVVVGMIPTEEYSVLNSELAAGLKHLDNPYNLDPKIFLGALGMPGLTAYSSFYDIGKPKKGETIFISAASGAVGQLVGQLAKHEGLKVVGSVGDDAKADFVQKELGFDGAFNYKTEKPIEALGRLAPDGVDIYYDNVGGEQLDAALVSMNNFGRIIACGMVSQYNLKPDEQYGIKSLMSVVAKRLTIRGFIVNDSEMGGVYAAEHQKNVQKWIHEGTFKAQYSVTSGIDDAVDGFLGMLQGKNFGKAILQIADLK
ncbi:MAG: hypothetical protein M1837_000707 [Sclerophora amabilis]|nr:MAG: hypothetical protein M1837_000707 [Sclerophora amabilis]